MKLGSVGHPKNMACRVLSKKSFKIPFQQSLHNKKSRLRTHMDLMILQFQLRSYFPGKLFTKLNNFPASGCSNKEYITPKMVKKVITNLDSSNASGPDCIPVVVLNNYEPELSYILAKLFSKCLKESCFPDCWKVSSVVPVFKNVVERSTAKNYRPVSLLSAVSKVFKKLVNNRIVDHLEKCGLFF